MSMRYLLYCDKCGRGIIDGLPYYTFNWNSVSVGLYGQFYMHEKCLTGAFTKAMAAGTSGPMAGPPPSIKKIDSGFEDIPDN